MRLRLAFATILRRLAPAGPPATPREVRARRALEVLLAGAALANGVALAARPAPPEGGPPWAPLPVDVATDGAGRLRLLPGLGPARTRAILRDRVTSGPVPTVDALDRVPGLGPRTVEALRRAGAVVRSGTTVAGATGSQGAGSGATGSGATGNRATGSGATESRPVASGGTDAPASGPGAGPAGEEGRAGP